MAHIADPIPAQLYLYLINTGSRHRKDSRNHINESALELLSLLQAFRRPSRNTEGMSHYSYLPYYTYVHNISPYVTTPYYTQPTYPQYYVAPAPSYTHWTTQTPGYLIQPLPSTPPMSAYQLPGDAAEPDESTVIIPPPVSIIPKNTPKHKIKRERSRSSWLRRVRFA